MMSRSEKETALSEAIDLAEAELCRKLTFLEKVGVIRYCNLTFAYIDEQEKKEGVSVIVGKGDWVTNYSPLVAIVIGVGLILFSCLLKSF